MDSVSSALKGLPPKSPEEVEELSAVAKFSALSATRLFLFVVAFWLLVFGILAWWSDLGTGDGVAFTAIGATSLANASFGIPVNLTLTDVTADGRIQLLSISNVIPTLILALALVGSYRAGKRAVANRSSSSQFQALFVALFSFSGVIFAALAILNLVVSRYGELIIDSTGSNISTAFPRAGHLFLAISLVSAGVIVGALLQNPRSAFLRFITYFLGSLRNFLAIFGSLSLAIFIFQVVLDALSIEVGPATESATWGEASTGVVVVGVLAVILLLPTIAMNFLWANSGAFFTLIVTSDSPALATELLEAVLESADTSGSATSWTLWETSPIVTALTTLVALISAIAAAGLAGQKFPPRFARWWQWPVGILVGVTLMLTARRLFSLSYSFSSPDESASQGEADATSALEASIDLFFGATELSVVLFGTVLSVIFVLLLRPSQFQRFQRLVGYIRPLGSGKLRVALLTASALAVATPIAGGVYQRTVLSQATPHETVNAAIETLLKGTADQAKGLFAQQTATNWLPNSALDEFRLPPSTSYRVELFNEGGNAWQPGQTEGYAEIAVEEPVELELVFDFTGASVDQNFGTESIEFTGSFRTPEISVEIAEARIVAGQLLVQVGDSRIPPGDYFALPGSYDLLLPKWGFFAEESKDVSVGTASSAIVFDSDLDTSAETLDEIRIAIEEEQASYIDTFCTRDLVNSFDDRWCFEEVGDPVDEPGAAESGSFLDRTGPWWSRISADFSPVSCSLRDLEPSQLQELDEARIWQRADCTADARVDWAYLRPTASCPRFRTKEDCTVLRTLETDDSHASSQEFLLRIGELGQIRATLTNMHNIYD